MCSSDLSNDPAEKAVSEQAMDEYLDDPDKWEAEIRGQQEQAKAKQAAEQTRRARIEQAEKLVQEYKNSPDYQRRAEAQKAIEGLFSEGTPFNEGLDTLERNIAEYRRIKSREQSVKALEERQRRIANPEPYQEKEPEPFAFPEQTLEEQTGIEQDIQDQLGRRDVAEDLRTRQQATRQWARNLQPGLTDEAHAAEVAWYKAEQKIRAEQETKKIQGQLSVLEKKKPGKVRDTAIRILTDRMRQLDKVIRENTEPVDRVAMAQEARQREMDKWNDVAVEGVKYPETSPAVSTRGAGPVEQAPATNNTPSASDTSAPQGVTPDILTSKGEPFKSKQAAAFALAGKKLKETHEPVQVGDGWVGRVKGIKFSTVNPKHADKNLFLGHNLTSLNLLHADKMGGLATPSLAVSRKEHPISGFGEITLLADPKTLNDSSMKTFNADVYSPRYPSIKYEINRAEGNKDRKSVV